MSTLSIGSALQSINNPFAMPVRFDFSADVGSGEQVLAYAVAMSGFMLNYDTGSDYWAEPVGRAAVNLVPNLVGNVLQVDGNVVLTDFNDDSARSTPGDNSPVSGAQITAIALIDSSDDGGFVLGNACGLPSGQNSAPITVAGNTDNQVFVAGFSVEGQNGSTGSIAGFSVGSSVGEPIQQAVTVTGTVNLAEMSTTGAVDVGLLSVPAGGNQTFGVQPAAITWGAPNGGNGMLGSLSATFQVPAGKSIVATALLLESVNIVYEDTAEIQQVSALQTGGLQVNGSTVTGQFRLNMYNPDFGARTYISSTSTASIYVIAQFG